MHGYNEEQWADFADFLGDIFEDHDTDKKFDFLVFVKDAKTKEAYIMNADNPFDVYGGIIEDIYQEELNDGDILTLTIDGDIVEKLDKQYNNPALVAKFAEHNIKVLS